MFTRGWLWSALVVAACGGSSSPSNNDAGDNPDAGSDAGPHSSTTLVVGTPIGTSDVIDGPVEASSSGLARRGDHFLLSYTDVTGASVVNIGADGVPIGTPTYLGASGSVACTVDGSCIVVSLTTDSNNVSRFSAVVISPSDAIVARLDLGEGNHNGNQLGLKAAAFAGHDEFFVSHTTLVAGQNAVVRIGTDGVVDGTPLVVDTLLDGTCGNNSGCWVGVNGTNLVRLDADGSVRTAALPANFNPQQVACEDYGCLLSNIKGVLASSVARIAANDTIETPTFVGYLLPDGTQSQSTGAIFFLVSDANGFLIYQPGMTGLDSPKLTRIPKTGPIGTPTKVSTSVPANGPVACTATRCLLASAVTAQPVNGYLLDGTSSLLIGSSDHAPLTYYEIEQGGITFTKRPTDTYVEWVDQRSKSSVHLARVVAQVPSLGTRYEFPGQAAFGTAEGFVIFNRATASSTTVELFQGGYTGSNALLTTVDLTGRPSDFTCAGTSCLFAYSTAAGVYAQPTNAHGEPVGDAIQLATNESAFIRIIPRSDGYVVEWTSATDAHAQIVSGTGALGATGSLGATASPRVAIVGDKLLVPRANAPGTFALVSADFATSTPLTLPTLGTGTPTLVGTAPLGAATFVLMRSGDALYGFRIDTDGAPLDEATPIATSPLGHAADDAIGPSSDDEVRIGYVVDSATTFGTHARLRSLTITTQPAP